MIQEFAIDPEAIEDFKDLRFLMEAFGFCKGRVISELPNDWAAQVHHRIANTGKIDDVRITEALVRLKEATVRRRRLDLRSFISTAQAEHRRIPFHAILTVDMRMRELPMVPFSDVVESNYWTDPRSFRWPRIPGNVRQTLPLFASMTRVLHLVDPYLNFSDRYCGNFIQELLMLISRERGVEAKNVIINAHISEREATSRFRKIDWEDAIRRMRGVWQPLEVRVHVWTHETIHGRVHNRYVLNDRGGLQFGDSLALTPRGAEDTVHVLGDEPYQALRKRLEQEKPVKLEIIKV